MNVINAAESKFQTLPAPTRETPLLSVKDLAVTFGSGPDAATAVSGVSFDLHAGSTVGVVGESGSGKSVTALAITRLFPKSARAKLTGSVMFRGRDLLKIPSSELRALRGAGISYVFQDPLSSLNPLRRCGEQVAEAIRIHEPSTSSAAIRARVQALFERLGLPADRRVVDLYPHELSGGMRQRVMIAIALACRPALLIADEPTTALDVVVQKQIVDLLREVVDEFGTSVLFISHDLALVSSIADEIVVMRSGAVVETGAARQVATAPRDSYTKQLWGATPSLSGPTRPALETRRKTSGSGSDIALTVSGLSHSFGKPHRNRPTPLALDNVDIEARAGETLCVVGESGSGKSTLARCVVGLLKPNEGRITFQGHMLVGEKRSGFDAVRRDIQMVFQDPYASLNPRMRVSDLVAEGLVINRLTSSTREARKRAVELLELVGLQARHADRFPHQFSGGQRQRIAIARAIALRPKLLVCDEPVTSLDVSVRSQIVQLLIDIQDQEGLTYLFITHDIALARQIGDRVVVMHRGRIVEAGEASTVIDRPTHEYTRALRAAVPEFGNYRP